MIDLRIRSRVSPEEIEAKVGRILVDSDYNALLTGPSRVSGNTGNLLAIYLPGAIPEELRTEAYPILTTIRAKTYNRGLASGSKRVRAYRGGTTYSRPIMSSVLGALEGRDSRNPVCRLTAWTGEHLDQWRALFPFMGAVARLFEEHVPDRYRAQMDRINATQPEWVIKGTPFTTVTVNNSYATGVHKDEGDLGEGFSCLAVLRRGDYSGGRLTFPEYRFAVDLQDGDCLLMDAHGQWHGNTEIVKRSEDAERISTVLYMRTDLVKCEGYEAELAKAKRAGAGSL